MTERLRRVGDVAVLALLAYLPSLLAAPGRIPADTKLYLYLDPGRLIGDAVHTWDPAQFAGWVPHQTMLYLWPSGPWYWLFETIGVPDWVAHRLWIGTVLFAAGMGARFLARTLGLGPMAAAVTAIVVQLSPYVLPYISRTSVMLLPWAGMGWITAWTVQAARTGRWRPVVYASLVVLTVTGVNATATLMIAPAPLLWLLVAGAEGRVPWRDVVRTVARIGVLSFLVSLWWIAKLVQQGRFGAAVLSYSETLEAVSNSSTSTEVVRGLGYWLFYVRDPIIATTTAATHYLTSYVSVLVAFAIVLVGLTGLVVTRWSQRRYAALLVACGVVLAVGAHPMDAPTALQSILYGDPRSGLSLALRSSTRAVPLLTLGLALGAGALVAAVGARTRQEGLAQRRAALAMSFGIVALAVVNLPALWTGGFVDPALEHDQDPPEAWLAAAQALDDTPSGERVMQIPGQESAAFRWGYTVDPPLPGLTRRPVITRDWLPLGSPAVMDLFYAFDDRIQQGVLDPASIAPVARLLGVDTIWLTGDIAHDRFRTARPEPLTVLLGIADGLGESVPYGPRVDNVPRIERIDEESLDNPVIGVPLPVAALTPVDDPVAIWRAKTAVVVVAGSGDGVVDAAAAGLIDGTELLLYAADDSSSTADERGIDGVILTDSNRRRAHHWRSSQDVTGFTEGIEEEPVLVTDVADQRIPVFVDQTTDDQTIAEQRGPVTARASAYGDVFGYRPEVRAAMALDGDPTTAWTVADRADPVGQFLELHARTPVDSLTLTQPRGANRWIAELDLVDVDTDTVQRVVLDESSRSGDGQRIELDAPATTVQLRIAAVDAAPRAEDPGLDGVGFAEVDAGLGATREVVRPPLLGDWAVGRPLAVVLQRERVSDHDRHRSDPERTIARAVVLPEAVTAGLNATVRFDARADDATIADLFGLPVEASGHLLGSVRSAGWAAFDGDNSTAWHTPFTEALGSWVRHTSPGGGSRILIDTVVDDQHSRVTEVTVTIGDRSRAVAIDADGSARLDWPALSDADEVTITISGIEGRTTVDRRTFDVVQLPAAIAEIRLGDTTPVTTGASLDVGCRDDLLQVAGRPVSVRFSATADEVLDGRPLAATPCDGDLDLADGESLVETATADGWEVDQVVLRSRGGAPDGTLVQGTLVDVEVVDIGRTSRTLTVAPCPEGCWVVQGEGSNPGWRASVDGTALGPATVVDGGMSGWWLPPSDVERTVVIDWTPQRAVTIAIVVSLVALVAAAALALRDRRTDVIPDLDRPVLARPAGLDRRRAIGWTVLGGAVAWFVAGPAVGAAVAIAGAVTLVFLGSPLLLAVAGLVRLATIGVQIAWRVRRGGVPADYGFTDRFDDLHRPTLTAIALVVVALVCATTSGRSPKNRQVQP